MKKDLIFHIGMPKCASSSIQQLLCSKEFYELCNNKCVYVVFQENGEILEGSEIIELNEYSPYGYLTSAPANLLLKNIDKIDFKKLISISKRCEKLILSTEWWGYEVEDFVKFLVEFKKRVSFEVNEKESIRIKILMFIRPQIEWLNSAYWQWGAWEYENIDEFIENYRERANWLAIVELIKKRTNILPDIIVMKHKENALKDFLKYMEVDEILEKVKFNEIYVNRSTPEVLIRLYQKYRELRSGPHDSSIDFIIKNLISLDSFNSTPWIFDQTKVKELIEYYRPFNKELLRYLREKEKEKLLSEKRYWSAEVYSEKQKSPLNASPDREELERLCVKLIIKIYKLYTEYLFQKKQYDSIISDLKKENEKLKYQVDRVYDELRRIYSSKSWKITKPLRWLRTKLIRWGI